jgi:Indolepyruvate ferredoxin oxidoreductase, alpha and beta subunits
LFIVSIDEDQCSGCNSCTEGCPGHLLGFDEEKSKAQVTGDESECLGCESCISVCPTGAVTITEM